MSWNVFPSQKYVSFVKGMQPHQGKATGTFQVTNLTKGEGFRFRIEAEIGDAIWDLNFI